MKIDFGKWLPIGFKLFALLPSAIGAVEQGIAGLKGKDKKAAAIQIAQAGIATAEDLADKDLLNDDNVAAAISSAVDAYVNVQNVIAAAKQAKATKAQ